MADRPEARVITDLLVRVWGMDKDGRPFFQNAQARNISSEGALLTNLQKQLTVADVVGVQYGSKKARFRVIWLIDAGPSHNIQAGVQLLDGQQCPWLDQLESATTTASSAPSHPANKRRFTRHKIQIPLDMHKEHGGTRMQTNATDIGGRGCYVETLLPFPVGTILSLTFWVEGEKFSTSAIVRASDGGVGMGIEFTGLDDETQQRLQQGLEKVAANQGGTASGHP